MQLVAPTDYRSDKMESREGRGLALERRRRWEDALPKDLDEYLSELGNPPGTLERVLGKEQAEQFWKERTARAKERSDLRGFWVSWHVAGGFGRLEAQGWDRSTIFRKIKRFREMFGSHPDEYKFDWIRLDPAKAWTADVHHALTGGDDDSAVL